MKTRVLILVLILICVFGVLVNLWWRDADVGTHMSNPGETDHANEIEEELTYSNQQYVEEGDNFAINISYPDSNDAQVNAKVNDFINESVADFKFDVKTFSDNPTGRKYTLTGSYDAIIGDNYKNFVFNYAYDLGGAHPNSYIKTLTFDKDLELVRLDKFLQNFEVENPFRRVVDLTQKQLISKYGDMVQEDWLKEGSDMEFDNYEDFSVANNILTIYFEPYEVGPYALGPVEVDINLSEVK